MQAKFNRLRSYDKRLQIDKSSRNLSIAFRQLNTLKDRLSLSNAVIEKTAYIYRRVQQDGLVKGRKISTVLSASLYMACREFDIPRTLREIIKANNGKYSETARAYRQIVLHLDQKIPQLNLYKITEKVGRNANIEEKNIRIALKLIKKLETTGFSAGRDPMGMAGAIVYMALPYSNKRNTIKKVTQTQIAHAAGVSEVTIRAATRQISKMLRLG
jgi:transcription initiation factor TFIIB